MKARVRYQGAIWEAELILNSDMAPFCYQIYGHPAAPPGSAYHLVRATEVESALPQMRINTPSTIEGGQLVFVVSLEFPSTATITARYETQDGAAIAPGDYTPVSGTLMFLPGQISQQVAVQTIRDSVNETREFIRFRIFQVVGAIAPDTATGTIDEWLSNSQAAYADFGRFRPLVEWIDNTIYRLSGLWWK
jgi:Calx-beta domain